MILSSSGVGFVIVTAHLDRVYRVHDGVLLDYDKKSVCLI